MLSHYTDPAEISGIADVAGRNNPCKSDGLCRVKCEPPMPMIEFRNGSAAEKRQPMKLSERIRNVIFLPIDLLDPIHQSTFQRFACSADVVRRTICRWRSRRIPRDASAAREVM